MASDTVCRADVERTGAQSQRAGYSGVERRKNRGSYAGAERRAAA